MGGTALSGATAGRPAVVLLSGGLDSATCLAIARADGFAPIALSFRYGQRHDLEVESARILAEKAGVEQVVCEIDLRTFGGSALTADIDVPKHDHVDEVTSTSIPITYVPARNTIFLAYALALAEVRGGIGHLHRGQRGRLQRLPGLPARVRGRLRSPGQPGDPSGARGWVAHDHPRPARRDDQGRHHPSSARALGVDYADTTSCYDPSPAAEACGRCDACLLRAQGFRDAGVADPTRYRQS